MSHDRPEATGRIQDDIARFGAHISLVQQGNVPRFAYTIGLFPTCGFEYVLAGASLSSAATVRDVLNAFTQLEVPKPDERVLQMGVARRFQVRSADTSWSRRLLLGATAFYGREVEVRQIVPNGDELTIDVPDMSRAWSTPSAGPWAWLEEPWPYAVPQNSLAMTNAAAMRGAAITEAARWENAYWEMFAGPGTQVDPAQAVPVPIGVLVAHDSSLERTLELDLGTAVFRSDGSSPWQPWGLAERPDP